MVTTAPHYLTTMEQVLLLSLALQWHKQARQIDNKELKQREKEIWLSHIKCIAKVASYYSGVASSSSINGTGCY